MHTWPREVIRRPGLSVLPARGPTRGVVMVLHGGAQHGVREVRPWSPPFLRMAHLAGVVWRAVAGQGIEVWLLRNRVRGWNAPRLDPVHDGRMAMARLRALRPGVPVALVGHSMGGRVAFRLADDPAVTAVCGLAPWTTEKDWTGQLESVRTVLVHGSEDSVTSPESSYAFAERACAGSEVLRFLVVGEEHRMLRRPGVWSHVVRAFARDAFAVGHPDGVLERARSYPAARRLEIAL
ncbi:alpha/beta hydrolase [Haloechinothrix aidingensis]|uniref:alpha/beta hydrolase n=1 Tax=Haloechinothrix aidingensis TaxID=2752311 RepID=UPI0031B5A1C6